MDGCVSSNAFSILRKSEVSSLLCRTIRRVFGCRLPHPTARAAAIRHTVSAGDIFKSADRSCTTRLIHKRSTGGQAPPSPFRAPTGRIYTAKGLPDARVIGSSSQSAVVQGVAAATHSLLEAHGVPKWHTRLRSARMASSAMDDRSVMHLADLQSEMPAGIEHEDGRSD